MFGLRISAARSNNATRSQILHEKQGPFFAAPLQEKGSSTFRKGHRGRDPLLHETSHLEVTVLRHKWLNALFVVFLTRVSSCLLPLCPCSTTFLDATPNVQSPLERHQTMVEYRAGRRALTAGWAASSPSEDAGKWHCLRGWDQRAKSAKLQRVDLSRDGILSDQDNPEDCLQLHMKIACVVIGSTFLWIPSAEFDASNIIKCHHAACGRNYLLSLTRLAGRKNLSRRRLTTFAPW